MTLILFALVACKSPADDSAPPESEAPAPEYNFYIGQSAGQTPDGSYVEDPKELLFIRALDESAATVTEYAWELGDPRTDYSLVNAVDLENGTFHATFATAEGTLDVVGAFDAGAAWAWTGWHSTSTYTDGQYAGWRVESTDTMDSAGDVVANKSVLNTAGEATWQIVETLGHVERADFETRLAEVGGELPF